MSDPWLFGVLGFGKASWCDSVGRDYCETALERGGVVVEVRE